MGEETGIPEGPHCAECGLPLDETGICDNTDICVAAQEAEERVQDMMDKRSEIASDASEDAEE